MKKYVYQALTLFLFVHTNIRNEEPLQTGYIVF